jgi:hypothetical protein
MGLVNLASGGSGGSNNPSGFLSAAYPLGLFGVPVFLMIRAKRRGAHKLEGTVLAGTAQALSARREPGLGGLLARLFRIGRRVEIPGRSPYDVTVTTRLDDRSLVALCVEGQRWEPGGPWHGNPGTTFAVEVDSANPENVRIVSPSMPPQTGSSSWPAQTVPGTGYEAQSPFNGTQPTRRFWYDNADGSPRAMSPRARTLMHVFLAVCVVGFVTMATLAIVL